jgi:hypothetical protein
MANVPTRHSQNEGKYLDPGRRATLEANALAKKNLSWNSMMPGTESFHGIFIICALGRATSGLTGNFSDFRYACEGDAPQRGFRLRSVRTPPKNYRGKFQKSHKIGGDPIEWMAERVYSNPAHTFDHRALTREAGAKMPQRHLKNRASTKPAFSSSTMPKPLFEPNPRPNAGDNTKAASPTPQGRAASRGRVTHQKPFSNTLRPRKTNDFMTHTPHEHKLSSYAPENKTNGTRTLHRGTTVGYGNGYRPAYDKSKDPSYTQRPRNAPENSIF